MGFNFQSLDTISLVDKFVSTFASEICEDGRIALLTDNNVFVYTLSNYMGNQFSDMGFKKNRIHLPKFSLKVELGNDFEKVFDNNRQDNLNKMMQKLNLDTFFENPANVEMKPISLKWSPRGLQGKSFCVLAVLNDFYGLSIMVEHRDVTDRIEYHSVTNVTRYIVEQASIEWNKSQVEITAEELSKHINASCPKAFIWSHIINNSYAILFVGHPQGSVTSWKFTRIDGNDLDSKPLQYMGKFMSSLKDICTMYWIKYGRNEGALCLGNHQGQLSAVRLSNLNAETLKFAEETVLTGKENVKQIKFITLIDCKSHSFLVTADEEFLHVYSILEDGTVLEPVLLNAGINITGICHYKDNILLVLTVGNLKKITLKLEDSKAEIVEENLSINFDNTVYKACGIVLSRNKVYLGIVAYPLHIGDITRQTFPSRFFIYHDASQSLLDMILSNTNESLADYWDIFEVLRMVSFKQKVFPWQGIGDIDYDKLTLPQLKSMRWIAKMSENIYSVVPRINGYHIKAYILMHHLVTIQLVVNRMSRLLNDIFQGKELTLFQMQSLDISNMYLKEMVLTKVLQKCKVGERFVDDIITVMERANEIEYPDMPPCFWCGEKIIGPSCLRKHKDSRCSISMMQIHLTPGFKCPLCECIAHEEVSIEYDIVTCPYCDVPMYKRNFLKDVQNVPEDTDDLAEKKMKISLPVNIPESTCPSSNIDCIPDMSLEDPGDPDEYLNVSDDDAEETLRQKIEQIRKEFFDPNNKTLDGPSVDLNDSVVLSDTQSKGHRSSDDYSFEEEEFEEEEFEEQEFEEEEFEDEEFVEELEEDESEEET